MVLHHFNILLSRSLVFFLLLTIVLPLLIIVSLTTDLKANIAVSTTPDIPACVTFHIHSSVMRSQPALLDPDFRVIVNRRFSGLFDSINRFCPLCQANRMLLRAVEQFEIEISYKVRNLSDRELLIVIDNWIKDVVEGRDKERFGDTYLPGLQSNRQLLNVRGLLVSIMDRNANHISSIYNTFLNYFILFELHLEEGNLLSTDLMGKLTKAARNIPTAMYLDELAWRLTRRVTPLDLPDGWNFGWNVIGSPERLQMRDLVNSWYDPEELFPFFSFIRSSRNNIVDDEVKRLECPLGGKCSIQTETQH